MTKLPATRGIATTAVLLICSMCAFGQNSYKIFDKVTTANSGSAIFATRTMTLVCPVPSGTFDGTPPPVAATLSSTADASARVFVDNYINLTLDNGSTATDLCTGAANGTTDPTFADCFAAAWHQSNSIGLNPDDPAFLSTNGVGPVNFTIPTGTHTLKFDEVDPGGLVGSSSIYLVTNCTVSGGTSTGTPITSTTGLQQSFTFSTGSGNQVFTGDWSTSQNSGDLVIQPGTVPSVTNQGISPANWPSYVAGTSFATTQCIPHAGEVDAFGNPLCKAYTLTCTYTGNSTPSGTNCPQSGVRNIYFNDSFDVASDYKNLLTVPSKTNNLGFGLLMGSDNWAPGDCVLTGPEDGFLCPQNLATSFHDVLSGGTTKGTNSTFIVVSGVPLPTTTVNGQANGGTITVTSLNPTLTFTTIPPTASGNGFTAAPIASVTYGIDSGTPYPDTTFPIPGDQLATPTTTPSCTAIPAGTFIATAQPTLTVGTHTLHFFATDCAATEELVYDTSDVNSMNNWASFKTVTINVGQFGGFLPPVNSAPTLNVAKGGSAIPVKFSLGGNLGLNIFAAGSPTSQQITCDTSAPLDTVESTVTAGSSSLQYDPTSNTYTYVWKTSSAWSGTCRKLLLTFADGKTTQFALFKFK